MPRKSVKVHSDIDTTNEKRTLIDSLELLRGNTPVKEEIKSEIAEVIDFTETPFTSKNNLQELHKLRQEVKRLQSSNILLESDLKRMEQKALAAIAESGSIRHQLDISRDNTSANENRYYTEERQAILDELRHSRHTHDMLSEAINESQNEIARLTKTLEKLTLRLLAA